MTISISSKTSGRSVYIQAKSRFDVHSHHDFKACYRNESPDAVYNVDFSETNYIDSSALGILLLLREYAGGEKSDITLSGCSEDLMNVMRATNFDKLFKYKNS